MDHTSGGRTFNRSGVELRRVGPPAAAWLTALAALALSAGFVIGSAIFRGITIGPSTATRLVVILALNAILLLLTFIAVLLVPWISPSVRLWSQVILSLALAFAGAMHFVLASAHLDESTLLGLGFFAAGALQIALAVVVITVTFVKRRPPFVFLAVIALNAALVFLYAVHVWLGFPLAGRPTSTTLGGQEDIDLPGIVTKLAELVSLVLGYVSLASFRTRRMSR